VDEPLDDPNPLTQLSDARASSGTGGPRPGGSRRPTPAEAVGGRATLWGAVLVAVAVLCGVVLLARGYDLDGGLVSSQPVQGPSTTSTVPGAGNPTAPLLPTTSTTAAIHPQSEVTVRVLNAGAKAGRAGDFTSKLKAAGYSKAAAGDAPKPVTTTQVYWTPGYQDNANEVARTLGLAQAAVLQIPEPPPAPLNGANVMVLVGPDVK
jgi:hypothetical protein